MLLDQLVGPLETGDYMLQCLVASITIRLAGIETRYRPRGGMEITDRHDNDAHGPLATCEGLKLADDQPLKLFLRLGRFFNVD